MSGIVSPCTMQQLLMVLHAKTKQPAIDLARAIQVAIPEATNEQKLSVAARLIALQNMLAANPSLKTATVEPGKVSTFNVAVLRAAARAPLERSVFVHETAFEVMNFNAVLREESLGQGPT